MRPQQCSRGQPVGEAGQGKVVSSSEEGGLVRDIYRELDQKLARCRKGEARQLRGEVKELREKRKPWKRFLAEQKLCSAPLHPQDPTVLSSICQSDTFS